MKIKILKEIFWKALAVLAYVAGSTWFYKYAIMALWRHGSSFALETILTGIFLHVVATIALFIFILEPVAVADE